MAVPYILFGWKKLICNSENSPSLQLVFAILFVELSTIFVISMYCEKSTTYLNFEMKSSCHINRVQRIHFNQSIILLVPLSKQKKTRNPSE